MLTTNELPTESLKIQNILGIYCVHVDCYVYVALLGDNAGHDLTKSGVIGWYILILLPMTKKVSD